MRVENKEGRLPYLELNFEKLKGLTVGLVPAVILDAKTGGFLMLGFMNKEAYDKTIESGEVVFWSRTQEKLWHKGHTSGNRIIVKDIKRDCDADTLIVYGQPLGPVCHRGTMSCIED